MELLGETLVHEPAFNSYFQETDAFIHTGQDVMDNCRLKA